MHGSWPWPLAVHTQLRVQNVVIECQRHNTFRHHSPPVFGIRCVLLWRHLCLGLPDSSGAFGRFCSFQTICHACSTWQSQLPACRSNLGGFKQFCWHVHLVDSCIIHSDRGLLDIGGFSLHLPADLASDLEQHARNSPCLCPAQPPGCIFCEDMQEVSLRHHFHQESCRSERCSIRFQDTMLQAHAISSSQIQWLWPHELD